MQISTFFKSILLVLLFFCTQLIVNTKVYAEIQIPDYTGYVNDFEGIIDNDEELEKIISDYEKQTGVEIAVLTVNSLQGTSIEDYSIRVFDKWKIGKADKDNGLLILVSSKERLSRVEVGYGLEGVLPDSLTGRVQDELMIPSFREGKYSEGINQGVNAFIKLINEDPTVFSNTSEVDQNNGNFFDSALFEYVIIGIIIFVNLFAISKSWWLGGVVGFIAGIILGYLWYPAWGWFVFPIPFAIIGLIIDFLLSRTFLRDILFLIMRVGFSGGGSGRSGGGVSFGGGSSGGGGSSRSW